MFLPSRVIEGMPVARPEAHRYLNECVTANAHRPYAQLCPQCRGESAGWITPCGLCDSAGYYIVEPSHAREYLRRRAPAHRRPAVATR